MADDSLADNHFYLTLEEDDQSRVLELVRVDGPKYYIRQDNTWQAIDPEADDDRVWDRVIVDVTPDAAQEFDAQEPDDNDTRPLDAFKQYEILDSEEDAT